MQIAVIGGRYKDEETLARIARDAGHTLEFESGHVRGRGIEGIRTAVSRAELVVIITEINSHGAVLVAKRAARSLGKPTLIVEKFSGTRLRGLIEALERRRQLATHPADKAGVGAGRASLSSAEVNDETFHHTRPSPRYARGLG